MPKPRIAMSELFQDLRFALRMLAKSPGFATIAVLTLALGIGANTAIFSVVNTVLLRSLPFPRAAELVDISARSTLFDFPNLGLSLPDIADLRASNSSLAAVATYEDSPKEISGDGKPQRIQSTAVSEDFFPVLGIQPLHGRTFVSADMQSGVPVTILSNSLWRERFGGDPATIGKSITIDGQAHIIVGVMPVLPALGFATDSALWTAFHPSAEQLAARDNHAYQVIARLKPHVRMAQAQSELAAISARLASDYPTVDKEWSIHAASLKQTLVGDARGPLLILFFAVGFVLMIACANVSNLFLSRGWARRREFAIRAALGATRGALLRQLAVECVLLALAGGASAFLVTMWMVEGLRTILPPEIPRLAEVRIDSEVACFTLAASLLAALLSGLAPALLSTRQDIHVAIKEGGADAAPHAAGSHNYLRQLLVIGEVALAAVLLIGATLAVRSFAFLLRQDLGFQPDHLVTLKLDFPKFRFADAAQAVAFTQQVLDRSRAIAGVTSVSAGLVFPFSDEVAETTFQTETSENDSRASEQTALANRVAPDFFRTLAIPLLAGRDFDNSDAKDRGGVVIVNEALARKYFGSQNVVGKHISMRQEAGHPVWNEILGVAGNVHEAMPDYENKPLIFAPLYQMREATAVYMVVRATGDPMLTVPALKDRIWSVDQNQPITSVQTMDARMSEVRASPKAQSVLLGVFGALGLLLSIIGVYGVMSYSVSQQTREIGIRMALGAAHAQILGLVVGHGLRLTLAGVFLGVAGGFALTRFMRSILFGISAADPLTFASVAILLTAVAAAACYIPARRATRVDPIVALRYE
jgi:putative ABC transport system permease protein